jgi:hypothetical protein
MTEATPEAAEPKQLTDDKGIPTDNPTGTGYAVYDKRLMRYVSPVHGLDDKPDAAKAKGYTGGGPYKVIKV